MAVRTMYLGAKLFQVLSQDSTAARGCAGWIDDLERKASTDSHSNLPVNDTANYLMIRLELSFLKFATVDTASGYNLLRKALPMFFQLVATETDLYKEHPNGNLVVSFLRTLNSTPHEFQRFVIYDTISALILGVPPLVEYGYDGGCDSSSYVFEWVHGIPLTLVEIVSQVNSWRAGSRVPLDDWKTMESRVLAWSPPPAVPGDDPAENVSVARSAVQESWRQVVLIYIYMGICGVSSHDSRVQASVHRIVQLGETVANLPIGIHVFAHCIVAGLAAKLEKHRVLIHKMLLSFTGTRAWLFRGPQFGEVLYHLWHGVGLGGGPVKWDDYVQSRCAVMPI
ncbi:hypothetical protein OPQ81_000588 [Rhizoctonia solani]|nr:hypothetical protein OPQ81_000588 [Rhizoctonia solani]